MRGAGEALLGDRRVDHALRPELGPQPLGVREGAAALAGAFAEIEDRRIAAHLLGDAVAHRVEPACHGAAGLRRRGQRRRRVQRLGEDMVERRRRIRLGRAPGELQRVLNDLLDPRVDRVELAGGGRLEILDQLLAERRNGSRCSPSSTSACVR